MVKFNTYELLYFMHTIKKEYNKTIFFLVKPYFLDDPEDVTVLSGEDVTLKCNVNGDPEPSVVWHREDGQIQKMGKTNINNGHFLTISNVTPEDEGVSGPPPCGPDGVLGPLDISGCGVVGPGMLKEPKIILLDIG